MTMAPDLLAAYRRAYRIRAVEEAISRRYHPNPADRSQSPMKCPVHLSVGQECISVGVAMAVEDYGLTMHGDDYRGAFWPNSRPHVWLNHRGHAAYLAFGGDLQRFLDELHGKATGCSGGRAGSMHLHDEAAGVMGGSPIVGSAVSLATGSAWAAKLEGSQRLTVVFCGDAVPETGQFWESLNFASLHKLRLLYVIEDNKLATATPGEIRSGGLWDTFAYASRAAPGLLKRAWDIFTYAPVEATNFIRVTTANDSWQSVYNGVRSTLNGLPGILRVNTTRACEHVGPEIDYPLLVERDPVAELAQHYSTQIGPFVTSPPTLTQIHEEVDAEIAAAFRAAEAAPWPEVA